MEKIIVLATYVFDLDIILEDFIVCCVEKSYKYLSNGTKNFDKTK